LPFIDYVHKSGKKLAITLGAMSHGKVAKHFANHNFIHHSSLTQIVMAGA